MRCLAIVSVFAVSLAAQSAPPVDVEHWLTLGPEAKWVAYKAATENDPKAKERWLRFFAASEEFELLEWIVLYDNTEVPGNITALSLLVAADAPQWVRCAVWRSNHPDSHTAQAAQQLATRAEVWSWLRKYEAARRGVGAGLLAALESQGFADVDVERFLPPLDPAQVLLASLDATGDLPELGDAPRAEPHVRYLHQVLRAIDALRNRPLPEPFWISKLVKLSRHAHPDVRRHAYQAFTSFSPERLPLAELRAVVDDAEAPPADREWALLAYSYGRPPEVFLTLHHVLEDPDHPAWAVAVNRLGEIGALFTVDRLEAVRKSFVPRGVAVDRLKAMGRARALLLQRLQNLQTDAIHASTRELAERALWARLTGDPLADGLDAGLQRQAMDRVLGSHTISGRDPRVFHGLDRLAADYRAPAWAGARAAELEAALRARAAELAALQKGR